jgi:hypothetical protein
MATACSILLIAPASAPAQSPRHLLERGQRAYQDLDFEVAAGLLRTAVSAGILDSLDEAGQADVLTQLAAADAFRGAEDSAAAVFRLLVLRFPRYRIDELTYPPEVTTLFAAARRTTRAVAVAAPREADLRVGQDRLSVWLHASSHHQVTVELLDAAGSSLRTLYRGLVGDSLEVRWDGFNASGSVVRTDTYVLRIASSAPNGSAERFVQIPLDVIAIRVDTLPHPEPPAEAEFRQERLGSGPGLRSLGMGLLAGLTVAVAPSAIASGTEISGLRFAVAGSLSAAGIVGFLTQRPGRPVPAHIAYNDSLRADWRDRVAAIVTHNANVPGARLRITVGSATVVEAPSR